MEPRITLVTIGVSDLPRSVRFYRDRFSWPTNYEEGGPVAFFNSRGVAGINEGWRKYRAR